MILHKLTLNNVSLFRGTQTIHLTPMQNPLVATWVKDYSLNLFSRCHTNASWAG